MAGLIFMWRSYKNCASKSSIQYALMKKRDELLDLQKYAAAIADGVSLNDLSSAPSSMFGDMMNYMFSSHAMAQQGTEQKFAFMQACGTVPQMQNPFLQTQYMNMIKSNLYEQEKERASQAEVKRLHVKEQQLTMEIKQLEDQLAMIEAEDKSVNDAKNKAISESAPRYV